MNRIDRMTVYRYVTYNDIFSKPEGFSTESSDKSVEEYEIEIPNNQLIEDVYESEWGIICFQIKGKCYGIYDVCSFLKEAKDEKTLYMRDPDTFKTIHFPIISRKRLY